MAMLDKQLRSLNVPLAWAPDYQKPSPKSIRTYLYTSDGGPDQQRYRKAMHSILAHDPWCFFIDASCDFHMSQLVVKTGLKVVDAWCDEAKQPWEAYFQR